MQQWNNPSIPEPTIADSEVATDGAVIIEANGVTLMISFDSAAEAQAFIYAYANAHEVVGNTTTRKAHETDINYPNDTPFSSGDDDEGWDVPPPGPIFG